MLNRDSVLEAFLEAQKNSLRNVSMGELIGNFLEANKNKKKKTIEANKKKRKKAYIELSQRLFSSHTLDKDDFRDIENWVLKIEWHGKELSDEEKILCASFWSRCTSEDTSGEFKKAERYIENLASQNHPQALAILAHIYHYKTHEYQKAFEYYQKAAQFGDGRAHFVLGQAYKKGFLGGNEENTYFVGEDHKTAIEHFQSGFRLGYYYSHAGLIYIDHGDYAKAVEEFKLSAAAGAPEALASLGHRYLRGQGVALDLDSAGRYYFHALSFIKNKATAEGNIFRLIHKSEVNGKLLYQWFNEGIVPSYFYEKLGLTLFEKLYSYISIMNPLDDRIRELRNLLDQNQAISKVVPLEKLTMVRKALNAATAERDKVFLGEKQQAPTPSVDFTVKPAESTARPPMDPEFLLKTYQQWEPLKQIAARPLIDLVKTFVDPNTDFLTRDRIHSALMDNTKELKSLGTDEMKKWIRETEEKAVISDLERAILSVFYNRGIIVKKDSDKAHDLLEKAADKENPFILYRQSRHLYYGTGVQKDLPASFTHALRAAHKQVSEAKVSTGYYYSTHCGENPECLLKARVEYEDGILLGNPNCLYNFVSVFGGPASFKIRCFRALMLTTNESELKKASEIEFIKLITTNLNLNQNDLDKIFKENPLPKKILSKIKNKKNIKVKIFAEIKSFPLAERIPALSNALNKATPIGQLMWYSRKLTAAKLKKGTLKNVVIELIAGLRMAYEQRLQLSAFVPAIQWCIDHKDEHKVDLMNLPDILKIAKRVDVSVSTAAKESVREIPRDRSHPVSTPGDKNITYPVLPAAGEHIPVPAEKPAFQPPYPKVNWQKPVTPSVDDLLFASPRPPLDTPILVPEIKLYEVPIPKVANHPNSLFVYTPENSVVMEQLVELASPPAAVEVKEAPASESIDVEANKQAMALPSFR